MKVWDSECGLMEAQQDGCFFAIDPENAAFILSSYETNGSSIGALLFLGPNADANAEKWFAWYQDSETEENEDKVPNFTYKPFDALKACFGL